MNCGHVVFSLTDGYHALWQDSKDVERAVSALLEGDTSGSDGRGSRRSGFEDQLEDEVGRMGTEMHKTA